MNAPAEKFTTNAQESAWIAQEAHRRHILSPEKGNLENATKETLADYATAEAKDFVHQMRVLPEHEAEALTLRLKPESHDKVMEELFGIMLEKGIKAALDVAARRNDPHLSDDFHRFLVQYLHTVGAIPGLGEKNSTYQELDHTLFAITLPPSATEEQVSFKSFIQAMKQFYTGLTGAIDAHKGQYYTLELAVEHNSRDISLYASVPRVHIETFEKLIHAYYPGAVLEESVDDYNIFSATAPAIAGSFATLAEPAVFPINTDDNFEHDPLSALIGSLTKLSTDGEGAAIQLTLTDDISGHNKLLTSIISSAQKDGFKIKDLYTDATASLAKSVGLGLLSMFKEGKKPDPTNIDTRGIDLATKKNSAATLSAGLRIIATAANLSRAQALINTIKASFAQFNLVESNKIEWKDINPSHINTFAKDFSFRSMNVQEHMILNINELATLFHLPVGLIAAPELKESVATTASAPTTIAQDGILIGTNTHRGTSVDVRLGTEDRVRHCYVIGQTGTGKTTILKNMIIQDIREGRGCCFMDPHGNDLEDILANIPPERLDDVIYFDPAYTARPMGLNMLEFDPRYPEQKIFVINELLSIFNKLFDMKVAGGPMFEQYFRNAAGLVMEDPASGCTLLEIGRVMSDKPFRDLKLSRCMNPIIKQFWENAERTTGEQSLANFVPYITNKFDVFVSNDIMRPVIAQQESVFNFREIMDNKKILLVNLSKGRLGDINSHLIGLVLVGKLTMAALSRVDMVGRGPINDFYLYIDEFQNVTTDSIATILSEARKYRLGLTVAHQYIKQLPDTIRDAVFGNVGNMIIYRVQPEDAAIFEKQLAPTFSSSDVIKLQNFNAYAKILVNGVPEKPFNLRIPPPPKGNMGLAGKVKELSYLKYGRPRAEVEAEIMARYQK